MPPPTDVPTDVPAHVPADGAPGSRVGRLPAVLVEKVEQVLDRVVRSAVLDPHPVHTADDVVERLEEDGRSAPLGGALLLALAGRTKKAVRFGPRAVPVAVVAKVGGDLVSSFRLGVRELELLASLVVQRIRASGRPVDARLVQRVTVNAYLDPGRRHDVTRARRRAAPLLAAMWAGRVASVEPAVGRMRKAAALVESIDFSSPRR